MYKYLITSVFSLIYLNLVEILPSSVPVLPNSAKLCPSPAKLCQAWQSLAGLATRIKTLACNPAESWGFLQDSGQSCRNHRGTEKYCNVVPPPIIPLAQGRGHGRGHGHGQGHTPAPNPAAMVCWYNTSGCFSKNLIFFSLQYPNLPAHLQAAYQALAHPHPNVVC